MFGAAHLMVSLFLFSSESHTHKANQGPSKSAVSDQKAPQGSETETETGELLGGTEDNIVSLTRGY